MAIKTLEEKYKHELGDIYDAEHQFLEAQQEMLPQATSPQVQKLLETHIKQTEGQIATLEQVFQAIGEEAKRVKCQGAAGIVSENKKTLKEVSSNPALVDLAIAGGSAKVEHYEIVSYRALVAGAEAMGLTKVARLLQKNLAQEEQTAMKVEQSMPKLLQQAMSSAAAAGGGASKQQGATAKGIATSKTGATSNTSAATQQQEQPAADAQTEMASAATANQRVS